MKIYLTVLNLLHPDRLMNKQTWWRQYRNCFASVHCKSSKKYNYWYSCFFSLFLYFEKNKRKLMRPPCCLSVHCPLSLLVYFHCSENNKRRTLRSPCCLSACASPLIVARQWIGKHNRRTVRNVIFLAIHATSKESRQLFQPRILL
jgi:hypothetical protein